MPLFTFTLQLDSKEDISHSHNFSLTKQGEIQGGILINFYKWKRIEMTK